MTHAEDAARVHEIVDREVSSQDARLAARQARVPALLRTLASETESVVTVALGDTGARLRGFASAVLDSEHPDLFGVNSGILADDNEFAVASNEMVKLAALAAGANLTTVLPLISKLVPKLVGDWAAVKELDDPRKTLNFVRLLRSRQQREEIRRNKKSQTVNLQTLIQKTPELWIPSSSSFVSLARNQTPFEADIEQCSRREQGMSDIGAIGLANRLARRALGLQQHSKERHYGFNRLSVTGASVIAGKMLMCDLVPTAMRSCRILVPLEISRAVYKSIGEGPPTEGNAVLYEPRLYPIHEIEGCVPTRTRSIIDFLEEFPEAGGCPIFDHYWCLVPSFFVLNIPSSFGDLAQEIAGLTANFDRALLRANATPAVLLGEVDGKSFFIDYFN